MAKDKNYKLNDHEKEIIKYFRQRAESNANRLIDTDGIEFTEENRDGTYRLTALVHFASFDMRVYYYPTVFPETEYSDYIDFALKFSFSEYKFSIYDIFNYLDIEDFNLYYYNGCGIKSSVDSAVDNIFAVCQKYMADIDYIAKRKEAVAKLEKQCDADDYITDDFESDDYIPDDEDMLDDFDAITVLRPACYVSKQQNVIKMLRKNEEKDLNSLYEKRLLKYLESGNSLPSNSFSSNKKSNKKYLKAELISYAVILVISFVFAFAGEIVIQKFIFSDVYVPNDGYRYFEMLGLPPYRFINALIAGFLFFLAFTFSFGAKIISYFASDEDKKSYSLKYITDGTGIKSKKNAKIIGIISAVMLAIIGVLIMLLPISDIGFYDDYVKFIPDNKTSLCEVSYDNLEIYQLYSYYDENEELAEVENAYAVADKQHTVYYEIGELVANGETEKLLFEISDEYGIEIQQMDTVQNLSELCGEVTE